MEYSFSQSFLIAPSHRLTEIWPQFCRDLLGAEFGPNDLISALASEAGFDIFHRPTQTAFLCIAVEDPHADSPAADAVDTALTLAMTQPKSTTWQNYLVLSNAEFSTDAIASLATLAERLGLNSERFQHIELAQLAAWSSKHPRIVRDYFDFRVAAPETAVRDAFIRSHYREGFVLKAIDQIAASDYRVVLTNNRSPVELELPFAPNLTVENLLDVGAALLGLSLDASVYHDLSASASLSLSIVVGGVTQGFAKTLSELQLASGDRATLWVKIVWKDESVTRSGSAPNDQMALYLGARPPSVPRGPDGEGAIARKANGVRRTIWQAACGLMLTAGRTKTPPGPVPVRLGASAPTVAKPGSTFSARFVAYHPDLEKVVQDQLTRLAPSAVQHLDHCRANWPLGTRAKVVAYGEGLEIEPQPDELIWNGEKHLLDFRVRVGEQARGSTSLKFDVFVEDLRVARVWLEIELSSEGKPTAQSVVVSSPRTAFASYASEDRLRVLDRVATLEIHCGLSVFLDCISMRPNAKWQELLPEMVLSSDQLLLFWSKAARDSSWVGKEWRLAFGSKGVDGIEVHPLGPYNEAPLPEELAALVHGNDPKMIVRAHEAATRVKATES